MYDDIEIYVILLLGMHQGVTLDQFPAQGDVACVHLKQAECNGC